MAYPKTYRAVRRTAPPYPLQVEITTETLPDALAPNDVLVRIHAVSLNYRDVAMLREGKYPIPVEERGIEGSDCAAEVVAVGALVRKFSLGDHVAPTINPALLTGDERDAVPKALGGDIPGTIREYAVYHEEHLVRLPEHLSWEEAATVMGVGITTWVSLDGLEHVPTGATVLLQGTGGVSVFALLFCLAAGIRPIITSSSDEKLEKAKKLSPQVQVINYKSTKDIVAEVMRLTDGKGVDFVFNNAGVTSIPTDLQMLRKYGGSIALIGFLDGFEADWPPSVLMTLVSKAAKIKGLLAGSRADFENVCKFLDVKKIDLRPLIDRVFAFDDVHAAFDYLESGGHFGKVVVKL